MNNLGKSRKAVSVLLALLMVLGLCAIPALAAEDSVSGGSVIASESFAAEDESGEADIDDVEDAAEENGSSFGDGAEEDADGDGADDPEEPGEEPDAGDGTEETAVPEEKPEEAPDGQKSADKAPDPAGEDFSGLIKGATQTLQLDGITPLSGSFLADIAELSVPSMKVNGQNYTPGNPVTIDKNTSIYLEYTWKLVEGKTTADINAGDYTILGKLPENLPFAGDLANLKIDIKAADNVTVIGVVTFDESGNIKLTFTDEIQTIDNVSGRFSIVSSIEFSKLNVPGDTVVLVMSDEGRFTIEAVGEEPVTIAKRFVAASMDSEEGSEKRTNVFNTLEWVIDVNTLEAESSGLVTDTLSFSPVGNATESTLVTGLHVFDPDVEVEVYELEVTRNALNHVVLEESKQPVDEGKYSVNWKSSTEIEIDLSGIEGGNKINKAYRIVLKTRVDYKRLAHREWATFTYTNTATLDGVPATDSYTVQNITHNNKASNYLSKTNSSNPFRTRGDVEGVEVIQWQLFVNRLCLDYGENFTITDILPEGVTFATGEDGEVYWRINELYFNDETRSITASSEYYAPDNAATDWTTVLNDRPTVTKEGNQDKVDFEFTNMNGKGYRIYLYTIIDDSIRDEWVLEGIENVMKLTVDGDIDIERTATAKIPDDMQSSTLTKAPLGDRMTDSSMSWRITYTTHKDYTAHDLVIADNYFNYNSVTTWLEEDSFAVTLNGVGLTKGVDFTLDTSTGVNANDYWKKDSTGAWFALVFKDPIPRGSTLVIEYDTGYNIRNDSNGFGDRRTDTFYNQAFSEANMAHEDKAPSDKATKLKSTQVSQTVTYDIRVNGIKIGAFDWDKDDDGNDIILDSISWTIDFNKNRYDFKGVAISLQDNFGDNQIFAGTIDSLKVYEIDDGGNKMPLVYGTDFYLLSDPKDAGSLVDESVLNGSIEGFTLLFPAVEDQHYFIEYQTEIHDPSVPLSLYTNGVIARKPGNGYGEYWFDAKARKPADHNVLSKNAQQEPGNPDLWHWTINLNAGKADLRDAVVTDYMSPGLRLVEGSIVVTKTSGAVGVLEEGAGKDYIVRYNSLQDGRTSFEISFIGAQALLKDAITITYDTMLDATTAQQDENDPNKYIVSNEVMLVAEEITTWDTINETVTITSGEGSAEGKEKVRFTIKKLDETGNIHTDLVGTTFALYAKNGALVVEEIVIRASGTSVPVMLDKDIYYLVETKAAKGFEKLTEPIEVDLTQADKTFELPVENIRKAPLDPLEVTKTAKPKEVELGENVTFTIDVHNPNKDALTGITLYDLLDREAFAYVSAAVVEDGDDNSGIVINPDDNGMVTFGVFDLAGGQTKSFTLTVKTLKTGNPNNVAIAISEDMEGGSRDLENPDTNEDNVDEDNVKVVEPKQPEPEPLDPLEVTKTARPKEVELGEYVTFTIDVHNPNDDAMTGITLYDLLDRKAFAYVSAAVVEDGDDNSGIVINPNDNGMVTWGLFDLAGGQTKTFTLTVRTLKSGNPNNVAIAISEDMEGGSRDLENPDANEDNVDEDDVKVVEPKQPEPEPLDPLVVTKTAQQKKVTLGDEVTFKITVENPNDGRLTDITLYDQLDKSVFEFVSGSEEGGGLTARYNPADGMVTFGLFDLEGGQSRTFLLTVKTLKAGNHNNIATAITDDVEEGGKDPYKPDVKDPNTDEDDVDVEKPVHPTTSQPSTSKPATTSRPSTTSSSSSRPATSGPSGEPEPDSSEPPVEPPVTPATSSPSTSRRVTVPGSSSIASSSSGSSSSSSTSSPSSEAPATPESTPPGGGEGGTGGGDGSTPTLEGTIIPDEGAGGGNATQDLSFAGVPLGGLNEGAAWSLLNLLMSVLSLLTGVVLLVGMLRRRKLNEQQDEDEGYDAAEDGEEEEPAEQRRRLLGLRLPAIIMALAPGILFLIFEDIRLPMTWITRWTPLIGAAFIVHMALVLVHFVITKRAEDEEPDDADGQPA